MKQLFPKEIKIVINKEYIIENNPVNMSNVVTFDKGFIDINGTVAEGSTNVVEHQGVGNKAQTNPNVDDSLDGFPAIIFFVNSGSSLEPAVKWVFVSVEDRNAGYNEIMDSLKKD